MATDKSVTITGSNLTGSDGTANRTYQLPHTSSIVAGQTRVFLDNSFLNVTTDYTISNGLITFLGEVWDDQPIEIFYQITPTDDEISTTSSAFATTIELARHLKIIRYAPDRRATGSQRPLENFGTGDDSTALFYLKNSSVLASSYTLYYGSTEAIARGQPLTETTHYTIDKDTGEVTLTATGITLVSTNKMYAEYSYVATDDTGKNLTNTEFQDALDRAQSEIEEVTQNKWANGSNATPAYGQVTNEKHTGKGSYDRNYFLNRFPLPDVSTTLTSSVAADDATINVSSTNGFPSSGSICIEDDEITYTGKTTTTFTGCTGAAAHDNSLTVHPYIISISTTARGSAPTFTVFERDVNYDLDLKSGRVQILFSDADLSVLSSEFPQRGVPNRFLAKHYLYGYETIPKEIIKLTLFIAKRELMKGSYAGMLFRGNKTDETDRLEIENQWIEQKLQEYKGIYSSTT